MKKIITSFLFSSVVVTCVAQNDTLLYENFDVNPITNNPNFLNQTSPPGFTADANWYNWDQDQLNDLSGGSRPGEWFWSSGGFAIADSSDGCMFSNSWTEDPFNPVENYLVTPSIQILDANAVLSWKSATRQTPRYLDGYKVVVSSTTNDLSAFTDEIFRAAEMTSLPVPPADTNLFSSYTFGPAGAWIQGIDGTYIEYDDDSSRWIGVQKDTSVSLAAYSGQDIYIAFLHYTFDDNLISIDDILLKGTAVIGYNEIKHDPLKLYAYPNPADKNTTLNFTLDKTSNVTLKVIDILGNEIYQREIAGVSGKNSLPLNIEDFSAGTYFYTVTSGTATSTGKFSIVR